MSIFATQKIIMYFLLRHLPKASIIEGKPSNKLFPATFFNLFNNLINGLMKYILHFLRVIKFFI